MKKTLRIIPFKKLFCIQDLETSLILDKEDEFSFFSDNSILFESESSAWNFIILKEFTFKVDFIGTKTESFNFDEKLIPLFKAICAGKAIKKIVCYAGEMNKNDPTKDFEIRDFFVECYGFSIASNFGLDKYFDLAITYAGNQEKKHAQFYMNWVKSFELFPEY